MSTHGARVAAAVALTASLWPREASAHHEALFGPQSSLAVESGGFVSLQAHEHVFGEGSTYDEETAYIVSAGVSPRPLARGARGHLLVRSRGRVELGRSRVADAGPRPSSAPGGS